MQPSAILFDLDGVLVDSETIANTIWVKTLADFGLQVSPHSFMKKSVGKTFPQVLSALLQDYAWEAPIDFLDTLEGRLNNAFDSVPEIEGAKKTLQALTKAGIPFAVGSNSERGRLHLKLGASGLADLVAPHAYDPSWVQFKGKPAPDLYLFAAAQLGVPIERCLVIEDSLTGMQAGVSAGATVCAFLAHNPSELEQASIKALGINHEVSSHTELRQLLGLKP